MTTSTTTAEALAYEMAHLHDDHNLALHRADLERQIDACHAELRTLARGTDDRMMSAICAELCDLHDRIDAIDGGYYGKVQ